MRKIVDDVRLMTKVCDLYYNQDISENMLLIEIGSEESYYEEVMHSLDILAISIDEMMR